MNLTYKNLPSRSKEKYVVTIGVFDGLHLGHQYILDRLRFEANRKKKPSLVISFDFPPEKVLPSRQKFSGYLTDCDQKIRLFNSLGIEHLWVLKATKALFRFSAADFLSYVHKYFPMALLLVGNDFRFGAAAEAGLKELKQLSLRDGFELEIVKKKRFAGLLASSSLVKELIKEARFKEAKKLLGRQYLVKGKVEKGRGVGRQLGFPTANLDTFDYVLPYQGVYAAYAKVNGKYFLAAVNIGRRAFESHIIDFSQNILGKTIEIIFLERLRPELNFQSNNELMKNIRKDIQFITSKYSIPSR